MMFPPVPSKVEEIVAKIFLGVLFLSCALLTVYLFDPNLLPNIFDKNLEIGMTVSKADRGVPYGGTSITVSTSAGERDIASFNLWPKTSNNSAYLTAGDLISVRGLTPLTTLAVRYSITSGGYTRSYENLSFTTLDVNGYGTKAITNTMTAGLYKFNYIKTSNSSTWTYVGSSVNINISPTVTLLNPTIELTPLNGAVLTDLKAGDQYGVKVKNGNGTYLKDTVLDLVYQKSDGSVAIAEQWARINSRGVALMTANQETGTLKLISIRIHKKGDESLKPNTP